MTASIRILIVDDHTLVRSAMHLMLDLKPGLEIAGEAQDGVDAIEQTRVLQPDVILMDLEMPRMGGLEAIALIHAEFPNVHIIVLTSFVESQKIVAAIKAGAQNYLLKNSSPLDLVRTIHEVYSGTSVLSSDIAHGLVTGLQQTMPSSPHAAPLTTRESEILRLAASGLSNTDIATRLFICEGTVRFHMSNIFSKLQIANRSQAILYAIRHGLMHLE